MTSPFLFLANVSQWSSDDEYIVMAAGITDSTKDIDDLKEDEFDYLFTIVCESTDGAAAAMDAADAWTEKGAGKVSLTLLSSDRREMTRPVRRMARRLGEGGVARIGSAIAVMRGAAEGRSDAEAIVRLACLRRPWQLWR